jgi:hypothetical protein
MRHTFFILLSCLYSLTHYGQDCKERWVDTYGDTLPKNAVYMIINKQIKPASNEYPQSSITQMWFDEDGARTKSIYSTPEGVEIMRDSTVYDENWMKIYMRDSVSDFYLTKFHYESGEIVRGYDISAVRDTTAKFNHTLTDSLERSHWVVLLNGKNDTSIRVTEFKYDDTRLESKRERLMDASDSVLHESRNWFYYNYKNELVLEKKTLSGVKVDTFYIHYEYDSVGNLIHKWDKYENVYGETKERSIEKNKYDQRGNLVMAIGLLGLDTTNYRYNKKGLVIKSESWGSESYFTYDERNNWIKYEVHIDKQPRKIFTRKIRYSDQKD